MFGFNPEHILCLMVKIKIMIEKVLPIMLCRFSNDFFTPKKCLILHNENCTCNEKKSGIMFLIKIVLISLLLPA